MKTSLTEEISPVQKFFAGKWTLELHQEDNNIVPTLSKSLEGISYNFTDLTILTRTKFHSDKANIGDRPDATAHYKEPSEGNPGIYSITNPEKIKLVLSSMHTAEHNYGKRLKSEITLKLGNGDMLFQPTLSGEELADKQWSKPAPTRALVNALKELGVKASDVKHMESGEDAINMARVQSVKDAWKSLSPTH